MDRNKLVKRATIYTTIFFVVIFLVGMVFFRKDDNIEENNLELNNQQLIEGAENEKITEEEKIESFAENFTTTFYSYTWGNFSNIESLKDNMTQDLWERELQWVEMEKEKIKNRSIIYIGISNIPQKANIIYLTEDKSEIEIECEQYEIEGASIYINGVLVGIDKFGEKSLDYPVYKKIENKKITLKLLRENNEWKVDGIREIKD